MKTLLYNVNAAPYGMYTQGGYRFHLPPNWPKSIIVKLTPVDWRVRDCGRAAEHFRPRLFGRRLERAISEYGVLGAFDAVVRMGQDPRAFMLPEFDYGMHLQGFMAERCARTECKLVAGTLEGLGWFGRYRRKASNDIKKAATSTIWELSKILPIEAVEALDAFRNEVAVDYLKMLSLEYMHDREPIDRMGIVGSPGNFVTHHGCVSIARFLGKKALPFIRTILEQRPAYHAANGAIKALGIIGNLGAVQLLEWVLDNEVVDHFYVRPVLDKMRPKAARKVLLARFPDIYPALWDRMARAS